MSSKETELLDDEDNKNRKVIIDNIKDFIKNKPIKPQCHKIIKTELDKFIDKSEQIESKYYETEYYKRSLIYRLFDKATKSTIKKDLKDFFAISEYISYKKFKFILEQNFKELFQYCRNNKITKIHVLLNTSIMDIDGYMKKYKEKSQIWMLQHLYLYMKNKKITDIEIYPNINLDEPMDDHSFVLVLDDASYSGLQLMGYLQSAFRSVKDTHITFYILVSFISEKAIENIIEGGFHNRYVPIVGLLPKSKGKHNNKHKYVISKNLQIIKPLKDYLTKEQIVNLFKWYLTEDYFNGNFDNIYNKFSGKYPIYFDHKLADSVSSFPFLYGGILPVLGNNLILNDKYYENEDDDEYYDIEGFSYHHNFIENCPNTGQIVRLNPQCPYPPYKKEFKGLKQQISSFSKKTFRTIKTAHSI